MYVHLKVVKRAFYSFVLFVCFQFDLQQITQSFFQATQFMEKYDTVLCPPFQKFESFTPTLYFIVSGINNVK